MSDSVRTIEDVAIWIARREAQETGNWAAQASTNERSSKLADSVALRVTALERRLIFVAGGAAAIGTILPAVLKALASMAGAPVG